jgi:acetate kinase
MLAPTHIASELVVLALNNGSSSLKFGRVGPTKADLLLTGEAEAIGGEGSQFHVEDSRNNARLAETAPIANQRDAVTRIGKFLDESGAPAPSLLVIVSCTADRSCGSIA